MATTCDLCGASCTPANLHQLFESYQVDGIKDLCPECMKWADKRLWEIRDEANKQTSGRMREDLRAKRDAVPGNAVCCTTVRDAVRDAYRNEKPWAQPEVLPPSWWRRVFARRPPA